VLVANHALRVPRSAFIEARHVESGFDVVDARILAGIGAGDLVVTADVPLAAQVVAAKAFALNPRGTLYTPDNVREPLRRDDLGSERHVSRHDEVACADAGEYARVRDVETRFDVPRFDERRSRHA